MAKNHLLVLLPPSETKNPGGAGESLDYALLWSANILSEPREQTVSELLSLCDDPAAAMAALKLGVTQSAEIEVNQQIRESPTMPAIERFTGVLYDALDYATLAESAKNWLGSQALIQTAPLGLVRAADPIPNHRLSAGLSRKYFDLKRIWVGAGVDALVAVLLADPELSILDLRSKAYAALAPLDKVAQKLAEIGETSNGAAHAGTAAASRRLFEVDVLSKNSTGQYTALNHFNKAAKGLLARHLALRSAKHFVDIPEAAADFGAEFSFDRSVQPAGTVSKAFLVLPEK